MLGPIDLGLTGLSVSPLCFGTGTQGWNGRSNQSDLGIDRLVYLLNYAHEAPVEHRGAPSGLHHQSVTAPLGLYHLASDKIVTASSELAVSRKVLRVVYVLLNDLVHAGATEKIGDVTPFAGLNRTLLRFHHVPHLVILFPVRCDTVAVTDFDQPQKTVFQLKEL